MAQDVVQDGIILKVPKDNVMISFKDINYKVLSSGAYKIEYIASANILQKTLLAEKHVVYFPKNK